eukprot:TRINITY_DN37607_c0_g1_i1.p1 TRINITY_DN37607_c0_g1~~TRINITY_DN37607_c0_g1_i1.p1  ORF type:complete len:2000 (+),score=486.85 TRINITY_DN37607_c0_g1_i1:466-6000(+)
MWGIKLERDGYGHINDNTIHGNKEAGIELEEGGYPFIGANTIYHEVVGISAKASAGAHVASNTIRDCHIGIDAAAKSCPEVRENTFSKNRIACRIHQHGFGDIGTNTFVSNLVSIEVQSRGDPKVYRNTFDGGNEQCIGVSIQGGGSFHNNIFTKLQHGIYASSTSPKPAVVSENKFRGNDIGVTVTTGSTINIMNNTFTGNVQAGIMSKDNGAPVCEANTFSKEQVGICITDACGEYTKNHFDDNEQGVVMSGKGCTPTVVGCTFVNNDRGVVSESNSAPLVEHCYFDTNEKFGLGILSYAVPQVHRCFFVNHGTAAIEVAQGAGGLVRESVVVRNSIGASILSHATTKFHRNHFMQSSASAVSSTHYGKGEVAENVFEDNTVDIEVGVSETCVSGSYLCSPLAIKAKDSTRASFDKNVISGKVEVTSNADPVFTENIITSLGVTIEVDGLGSFDGNMFLKPSDKVEAILLLCGGRPRAVRNTFLQCPRAVLTMSGGQGHFSKNTFTGGKVGVEVREGGDPYIGAGNVFDSQERGVVITGMNAKGNFERCEISASSVCGVLVEKDASPTFLSADVYDCKTGVHITKRGKGYYKECNIFDNSLNGVHVEGDCQPHLVRCKLSSALEIGALHKDSGAGGTYDDNKIKHLFSPVMQRKPCPRDRWEARKNNIPVIKKTVQDLEKRITTHIALAAEWSSVVTHLFGKWNVPLVLPTSPKTPMTRGPRPRKDATGTADVRKSVSVVDTSPPPRKSSVLHRRKSTGCMSRRSSSAELKKSNSAHLGMQLKGCSDLEQRKNRIIAELKAPPQPKPTDTRKPSIVVPKMPDVIPPRRPSVKRIRKRPSYSSSPQRPSLTRRSSSLSRRPTRASSLRRQPSGVKKEPILSPQAEALAALGDPNFALNVLSPASKQLLETPRAIGLLPRRSSGNLHKKLTMYADLMTPPSTTVAAKKSAKDLEAIPPFEWGKDKDILSPGFSPTKSAKKGLDPLRAKPRPKTSGPRQVAGAKPKSLDKDKVQLGFILSPTASSIGKSQALPYIVSPTSNTVAPSGILMSAMSSYELPAQTPEMRAPANTPLFGTIVLPTAATERPTSPSEISQAQSEEALSSRAESLKGENEQGEGFDAELNKFVFGTSDGETSDGETEAKTEQQTSSNSLPNALELDQLSEHPEGPEGSELSEDARHEEHEQEAAKTVPASKQVQQEIDEQVQQRREPQEESTEDETHEDEDDATYDEASDQVFEETANREADQDEAVEPEIEQEHEPGLEPETELERGHEPELGPAPGPVPESQPEQLDISQQQMQSLVVPQLPQIQQGQDRHEKESDKERRVPQHEGKHNAPKHSYNVPMRTNVKLKEKHDTAQPKHTPAVPSRQPSLATPSTHARRVPQPQKEGDQRPLTQKRASAQLHETIEARQRREQGERGKVHEKESKEVRQPRLQPSKPAVKIGKQASQLSKQASRNLVNKATPEAQAQAGEQPEPVAQEVDAVQPEQGLGSTSPTPPSEPARVPGDDEFIVSPPTLAASLASPLPSAAHDSDPGILSPDSEIDFVPTPIQLLMQKEMQQARMSHIDEDYQPKKSTEARPMVFEITPATPPQVVLVEPEPVYIADDEAVSISPLTTPNIDGLVPCGSKRSLISAQSVPFSVSELSYQGSPTAADLGIEDTPTVQDIRPLGGFDIEHIEEIDGCEPCDLPLVTVDAVEEAAPQETPSPVMEHVVQPLGDAPWGTHVETLMMLKKQSGEEVDCLLPRLGPPTRHPHRKNSTKMRTASSAASVRRKTMTETVPAQCASGFLSKWGTQPPPAESPELPFPPPLQQPALYLTYAPKRPQSRPWASSTQITLRRPYSAKG